MPLVNPEIDQKEDGGGSGGTIYVDPATGKYNVSGTNILRLAARKAYDAAPFSGKYTGEEEIQKAGTNTTNVTLTGYKIDGTTCTAVKAGCMPDRHYGKCFWSSSSAGRWELNRSSTTLTIKNTSSNTTTTYYPADFRDGVIPEDIVVEVFGGGGGGGGNGYFEASKGEFFRTCGGAGGGGGCAIVRINLVTNTKWIIVVGGKGTVGGDGTPDTASEGHKGGDGGTSSLTANGYNTSTALGYGGIGGAGGGIGSDGKHGEPGAGGAGGTGKINFGATGSTMSGGAGNWYSNHNASGCAGMAFLGTEGTGEKSKTVVTSKNNNKTDLEKYGVINPPAGSNLPPLQLRVIYDQNVNDPDGDNSYFSGGCSDGRGANPEPAYYVQTPNGPVVIMQMNSPLYGGGGGGGSLSCDGAAGWAALYY